jgi:hypothetical protein
MAVVSIMKRRKVENKGRRKARQGREGEGPKSTPGDKYNDQEKEGKGGKRVH